MAEVVIGALRYDIIADTEEFERDMFASRAEIRKAEKAMRDSRTPAQRYVNSIERLNTLRRKGLIDAQTYRRSLDRDHDTSDKQ